ncbi:hypothetical protein [uncultured Methanobacterium sp.]|uniref:hypothetical protein n=1 Tax=uncultured Methanobacterium sp. TaxID=176306 RepID=UPI002AA68901|nr:hypothetical protein [uncultured Methanobacterium sp.]
MKRQIIMFSLIVFISMSFSAVWANENPAGESNSQISTLSAASITPLMKSSSTKSSSSKKTHDGDDVSADNNSTSDDSSGFPWWTIIIIVIIVLVIIGLVIWYLFLR